MGKGHRQRLYSLGRLGLTHPVETARFLFYHSPLGMSLDPAGFQRQQIRDAHAVYTFVSHPENLKRLGQAVIKPYVDDIKSGHPGRALGRLLPDIALTIGTGGGFAGLRGGLKGAEIGGRIAEAEQLARVASEAGRGGKAVAISGDIRTLSGWGKTPSGYSRVNPSDILELQNRIGYPVRRAGPLDQGVPGQYYASHSERQLSFLRPGEPMGVSIPVCPDCQGFLAKLAQSIGQPLVVADPETTWVFGLPD